MNFCQPGEIVYDPYMGTGTTAEGCKMEGIHFIGSEMDGKQVKIGTDRQNNVQPTLDLY